MSKQPDLRVPVEDLIGSTYVASSHEFPLRPEVTVVGIRRRLSSRVLVSTSRPGSYSTKWRVVPPGRSLERVLSEVLGQPVRRTARVYSVTWGRGTRVPLVRSLLWFLASLVLVFLAWVFVDTLLWYLLLPGSGIWLWLMMDLRFGPFIKSRPTSVPSVVIRELRRRGRLKDGSLVVGNVEAPGDVRAASRQIDEVKAEYGALLSDVVYRIENSALFDPAVAPTREFSLLLARANETALDADATVTLAHELRPAFETARAHAERLGLKHLPRASRADARRAIKALRLADNATTDGERSAALEQASRILASLALYYLPDPGDPARMLGGGRRKLEGPGHAEGP